MNPNNATPVATLGSITRKDGVAGQYSLSVDVTYPNEPTSRVTFVSSTFGGPVLMITPSLPDGTFVSDPARFGKFSPEWIRSFFSPCIDR